MTIPHIPSHLRSPFALHVAVFTLLLTSLLLTGCATSRDSASIQTGNAAHEGRPNAPAPILRSGRYTLMELRAEAPQRDLLQQIVEIRIPPTADATVGEALRYLLLRTGYRLCESHDTTPLETLPLPAAHLQLGPLMLRDALELLAGSAWPLQVDEAHRQVCFGSAEIPGSRVEASKPPPRARAARESIPPTILPTVVLYP